MKTYHLFCTYRNFVLKKQSSFSNFSIVTTNINDAKKRVEAGGHRINSINQIVCECCNTESDVHAVEGEDGSMIGMCTECLVGDDCPGDNRF